MVQKACSSEQPNHMRRVNSECVYVHVCLTERVGCSYEQCFLLNMRAGVFLEQSVSIKTDNFSFPF